ncbi:vWA domain-containing protein [Porphyromonas somerae]|uniref:N-terminal double-transmembrane domain protein n=2 Tax=Porphyromonas TaxID=836 RepID=A0A134BB82_9PORP|nr:VWA domain-containing protein [Porphyromonas somerae]KXB75946.1 N-terminal double-transmembrane domain protein [Porphyromonadaceae bacterium KA00676]KXB77207.1 N-terminal double-transmembrane domain protein [Porphyromonas somerae]
MTFLHPQLLWLLLLLPALLIIYIVWRRRQQASLRVPSLLFISGIRGGFRVYLRHALFALRLLALGLIIVALARPQSSSSWSEDRVEGIDIMLTMDISTSMLAMDFQPNRVEAAKEVAMRFIANRPNDNIGLVVFAGESFTACPLTQDHATLINRLREMTTGIIADQTAIGSGLATAISRLKDSKTKSKVIILLTDGANNTGNISPKMAADLAKTFGISIYTIGVGSGAGEAPYPIQTPLGTVVRNMPVDLDEPTMQQIADVSGGAYFRATDNESLAAIYKKIDQLEKTKLSTRNYHTTYEEFFIFVLAAAFLLLLEYILRSTILRTNP